LRTCYSFRSTLGVLAAVGAVCAVSSMASAQVSTGTTQPVKVAPKVDPASIGRPTTDAAAPVVAKTVMPQVPGHFDPRGVPPNDSCASATAVGEGVFAYDNVLATTDGTFSCAPAGLDVWFLYTASAAGSATATTCAGDVRTHDTVMSVFNAPCGGASIGCNDDGPPFCASANAGFSGSTVTFPVVAGGQYLICIGSYGSGATGGSNLTISIAGPCVLTPPAGGVAEGEPCGSDANGGCNMAVPAFTPIAPGGVTLGDAWADANVRDTDWYEVTVAVGGTLTWRGAGEFPLRLFILDGVCPPALLATNFAAPCTEVSISAVVCAGTYRLFAGDNGFTGNPCGSGNNDYWAQLTFAPSGGGLPNDNCTCAQILPGPGTYAFTTVGATNDAAGSCGASAASPDVWYRVTTGANGDCILSTCGGTTMDTVLSAYNGCGGTELTCLDDFCGLQTQITVTSVAGVPTWFRISGFNNATGSGNFTLTFVQAPPPGNDDCANATAVGEGVFPYNNLNATTDGGTTCAPQGGDVWFLYTATQSGPASATTCSPNRTYDTVMNVYQAPCGGAQIGCNDDGPPACGLPGVPFSGSTVNWTVSAGSSYLIQIGSYGGGMQGSSDLTIAIAGPCVPSGAPNDCCASATPVGPGTHPFDTLGANTDGFLSCGAAGSDVWFDFLAPNTELIEVSTCGLTGLDSVLAVFDSCGGSQIVCLDDACGLQTEITFAANAGTHYWIAVAGFAGGQGTGEVRIGAPVPCAFVPDPNGIPEGEPCGSDTNGGCNSAPPIYTDVTCNGTWTGLAWAEAGTRDTDWYRFTLTSDTTVTATADTAFDGALFIVTGIDTCTPAVPVFAFPTCGSPATVSSLLTPGTYVIFVATGGFDGEPCGGNNGYNVTIDIGAAPCTPPCPCDFNNDTLLNSQDFFDFLACFFTVGCDADFNNDTIVNSQDFFDFLACFFAPPPGCA
jgi:hypothetical protein